MLQTPQHVRMTSLARNWAVQVQSLLLSKALWSFEVLEILSSCIFHFLCLSFIFCRLLGDSLFDVDWIVIGNRFGFIVVNNDHHFLRTPSDFVDFLWVIKTKFIILVDMSLSWCLFLNMADELLVVFNDPSKPDWVTSLEERMLKLYWHARRRTNPCEPVIVELAVKWVVLSMLKILRQNLHAESSLVVNDDMGAWVIPWDDVIGHSFHHQHVKLLDKWRKEFEVLTVLHAINRYL